MDLSSKIADSTSKTGADGIVILPAQIAILPANIWIWVTTSGFKRHPCGEGSPYFGGFHLHVVFSCHLSTLFPALRSPFHATLHSECWYGDFFLITSTWYMWSIWFYNAYFFPAYIRIQKKHIGKILEHSTYDHALQHIIKNIYHISTTSPCRKKTQKYPPFIMGNAGTIKNLEIFDELHFGNSSGVPWGCSWPSPSSPFSAAAVRWRSPEPSFRTWGDFMGK